MSKNSTSKKTKMAGIKSLGARDSNKLAAISAEITEGEKVAKVQLKKIARLYYDAGSILAPVVKGWKKKEMSAKAISEVTGFPANRVIPALKIFKVFENNPDALKNLTLRDTLKLIAPPPPAGEEGYNRIDLGGDPGQLNFNFGELFEVPAATNPLLENYRTVSDLLTEIIVVRRGENNLLTSKRFLHFCEDVPQNSSLKRSYKNMVNKTQAAIEDYLAAIEQEEKQK